MAKRRRPRKTNGKKNLVRTIREVIDKKGEVKLHDFSTDGTPINANWEAKNMTNLSNIAQGITQGTRIGSEINPLTLMLRISLNASSVGAAKAKVRIFIVRFTDQTFATSTLTIFPGNNDTIDYVNEVYNPDPSQRHRFQVLYDRTFVVSNVGGTASKVHIPINLRLSRSKPIGFAIAGLGGNMNNSLQLGVISDIVNIGDPPTYSYTGRLRYKDS